ELASRVLVGSAAQVQVRMADGGNVLSHGTSALSFDVSNLKPVDFTQSFEPYLSGSIDSCITRMIVKDLGSLPPKDWHGIITPQKMDELLNKLKEILSHPDQLQQRPDLKDYVDNFVGSQNLRPGVQTLLQELFAK